MLVNKGVVPDNAALVFSQAQIEERVQELAAAIAKDFPGQRIVLVGVLTGAALFTVDLARALVQCGIHDIRIAFLSVSSYRKGSHRDQVRIDLDLKFSIQDEIVILVEDIIDSGYTLRAILKLLSAKDPKIVKTAVMFAKQGNLAVSSTDAPVDYLGLVLPDNLWGIGYGLDVDEKFRLAPDVWGIPPQV
ncbi:hypothetical protein A2X44_05370 [candidate division CPR3 bacterium GWF2_35_18]|uniref:Hypoxanthine phosphoribosyltransferase n=1 Tax=candidate division CPR3 bacterium GW2011_GWF2_35_18 TaxID=1618350 RepID=A0A0G0BI60_UNCC3|nr:MAG: Hypoxanthine phosphoribosyltransferase [candidate division CPR3 bacterium GW2011_GWF2_35_18]KKP87192.1 MAG: Hypoxanthine phosphoribosyltransferase [candidate division CPR3 bacterium GW2011_GWE2_35_7]OGB63829.1 MAG: hypothetical protein A2X44_05370 [candidate division CPR3 bacterium GWF2_35_18]OGB65216.1 MAG: hypothetical protein A2250_03120 [candidate division CPR3 bacterium RIFOXYA2_FULL_35_13]OGB77400.1 MAG: hypothetical protein A2476_02875 [candidate division CPR3 bacterium RIFOXYC2_